MAIKKYIKEPVVMPEYTEADLMVFKKWLEKFRVEKDVVGSRDGVTHHLSFIDLREAMVADGAMSKKEHVGVMTYAVIVTEADKHSGMPIKFEAFMHKYEELQKLESRRAFKKAREDKYDNLVQDLDAKMSIHEIVGNEQA